MYPWFWSTRTLKGSSPMCVRSKPHLALSAVIPLAVELLHSGLNEKLAEPKLLFVIIAFHRFC